MDVDPLSGKTGPAPFPRPLPPSFPTFTASVPPSRVHMAPLPVFKPEVPLTAPREAEPASKRPKTFETSNSSAMHHMPPQPRSNTQSPTLSTSGEVKLKDASAKKKTAARSKKITDTPASVAAAPVKKQETMTVADTTPLRASNKAALDAMGLSWKEARYQPHPTLHPMKVALAQHNSSKRVHIHHNLVVNARGYNMTRANYPAQVGNWFFEILVTDAPTILQRIDEHHLRRRERESYRQMEIDVASRPSEPPFEEISPQRSIAPSPAENDPSRTTPAESTFDNTAFNMNKPPTPSFLPSDVSTAHSVVEQMQLTSSTYMNGSYSPHRESPAPQFRFPDYDASQMVGLTQTLQDMAVLNDYTRRPLPPPHWRFGWATEQADNESPVGTDKFGISWRDNGDLFHLARSVPKLIDIINSEGPGDALRSSTNPSLAYNVGPELVEIDPETKHPKIEGFVAGDVLGFGIELPPENIEFIKRLHKQQEDELSQQNQLLQLRRQVYSLTVAQTYPGADIPALAVQIDEAQAQIDAIKPIEKLIPPNTLKGTKVSFWKNGKLQALSVLDFPPGSYYPAISAYYQGAALVNFGPTFAHPPPPGYRPSSELNDAYQNPLPGAVFLPPPPTITT